LERKFIISAEGITEKVNEQFQVKAKKGVVSWG